MTDTWTGRLPAAAAKAATLPTGWEVVARTLWFGGLAAVVGTLLAHVTVVRPSLRRLGPAGSAGLAVSRRTVALAAVGALVAYVPRLVTTVAPGASNPWDAASPARVWSFVTTSAPSGVWFPKGAVIAVQGGLLVVTALAGLAGWRRPSERALTLAVAPAVAVQFVKAVPVSADAARPARLIGAVLNQGHIVAAGVWLGGLLTLTVLTRAHRRLGGLGADVWAGQWRRFSVLASASVGVVVVSGAWLTWEHVGSVGQMFTTAYGRVLSIKLALVLCLLAFGGYNQLVLMPRVERRRRAGQEASVLRLTVRHLGRVVLAEVGIGVGVLVAVAFLTGSARIQAGGSTPDPTATVWLGGVGLTLAVVAMLALTARLAGFLAARPRPERDAADADTESAEVAVSPR
ncbi:MAG: CopD family protein [Actinobacteria bacterium]|nr:CopD family protein [Actinomycetota bacterium]